MGSSYEVGWELGAALSVVLDAMLSVALTACFARSAALLTDSGEVASSQLLPPTMTELFPISEPWNPRLLVLSDPSELTI